MTLNLDKMKQERADKTISGDIWDVTEGEHNVYIVPPSRDTDEMPSWEFKMHYGLGPKGYSQVMCLEPANNPILVKHEFIEACQKLKLNLDGGCPVCEAVDAGTFTSVKDNETGKPSGRWLWTVMPISTRTDTRAPFVPFPKSEVKGHMCGWTVWDQIMDVFGQCGDITNPDDATLVRITRAGKKLDTKWTIGVDVETVKKSLKLSKDQRALIAALTQPGGDCDPYILVAKQAKPRASIEALMKGPAAAGEYEEQAAPAAEGQTEGDGSFKPPPGKKGAAPAKPAPAAAKPAAATSAKPTPAKGKSSDDALVLKLVQAHGEAPPCFKQDCDPNDPPCQACSFKEPCARAIGVPVPPDPEPEATEEAPAEEGADEAPPGIAVEECQAGVNYHVNGMEAVYKGLAKGKHYFISRRSGKTLVVAPGTVVETVAEEDGGDDDEELRLLEAELAKKAKPAAKK